MRIYKILKNTTVEGPGNRFCIWVQGCKKHCEGCFATDTWDFAGGKEYSVKDIFALIKEQKGIEGVTFLGGEPFEQAKELSRLAKLIKKENLSLLCFSGYTIDELKTKKSKYINELLDQIDLLIDGGFEQKNADFSRPWVGSLNQKFIYLTDRYNEEEIKKYKNKIEVRLNPNGELVINGMGNFENLKSDFCLHL